MIARTPETIKLARDGWPAKLGTIPFVVRLHGRDIVRLAPGNVVRVKTGFPGFHGARWDRVRVKTVDDRTLHFQADW